MNTNIDQNNKDPRRNKVMAGTVLLIVGLIILIHQLNFFFFPWWLFRWPMLLIVIGIYSGVKHNFRNAGWLILLFLGLFFLLDQIFPYANISGTFWPLILIAFGIKMILNRNRSCYRNNRWEQKWRDRMNTPGTSATDPVVDYTVPDDTGTANAQNNTRYGDDYLDVVCIFGGAKKKILSKDFKGGEIVNIFGGADIDFTQADIKGQIYIDVTQVFGGIKLIVPPHWHVTSDAVSLFAGFEDKRMQKSDYGSDKILVIKGTSIFAGIDIRSY